MLHLSDYLCCPTFNQQDANPKKFIYSPLPTQKTLQKQYLAFSNEIIANFLYLFSLINQFTIIPYYQVNGSVL